LLLTRRQKRRENEEHTSKQKQDDWERYEPACYSTAPHQGGGVEPSSTERDLYVRIPSRAPPGWRSVCIRFAFTALPFFRAEPAGAVRAWWPRRRRRGCERLMQVVSLRVITINETGCKFRDSGTVRSRSCLAASQQLSSIILAVPIRVPRARLRARVPQWILPDPGSRRRISPVHLRSSSPVLSHRSRLPGRGTAPPRGGPATR
jgi:hypothetical protein